MDISKDRLKNMGNIFSTSNDIVFNINARPKKFYCYNSLFYEKERLETFINWPLLNIFPKDLAANGFIYLRSLDNCACVFCNGIIGNWEEGGKDTLMEKHKRLFPQCPFVRGHPVGNIPFYHSQILDKMPLNGEDIPRSRYEKNVIDPNFNIDIYENQKQNKGSIEPKLINYHLLRNRIQSFYKKSKWPKEETGQTPELLAEAGFISCGLSDHVLCSFCFVGLRNWERGDDPWVEHARWSPHCIYVKSMKGRFFVRKIQEKNPLYLRTAVSTIKINKKSSGKFNPISEKDLKQLMESDIIKVIKTIDDFSLDEIRAELKQKLVKTGIPFLNIDECIKVMCQRLAFSKIFSIEELPSIAKFQLTPFMSEIFKESCSNKLQDLLQQEEIIETFQKENESSSHSNIVSIEDERKKKSFQDDE